MAQDATFPLSEPVAAQRQRLRATYASLGVAGVLIAAKLVVWISTGSVALLSSLVDSLVDIAASLLNFIAVRHAIVPADREHRFGHGKAEPLAGLGQSAFIAGSGLFLMIESANRLLNPAPIGYSMVGIAILVGSIALTLVLVAYQSYVVRRT